MTLKMRMFHVSLVLVIYGVVLLAPVRAEENKLYLSAESMTHVEADEAIVAEGDVHLAYGGYVLSADKVVVLKGQDKVIAEGQVRLLKPSGDTIFATYASLDRDLSRGIVRAMRVALDNGERFVAAEGRLNPQASIRYVMNNAAYTPCRLCLSDDGEESFIPWTISADTVVRDEEDSIVRYYNAVLSLFGLPVFYTPYYSHPDPQVVRKSGLLRPILGRSSLVGNSYGIPFYFTPNQFFDMTLTPIYYSKGGWLFDGELRWRTERGGLTIDGSVIGSDPSAKKQNRDEPSPSNGFGRAKGQFAISEQWRWGFDAAYVSDDTYLRRYDIDNSAQVLTKAVYAEGFFKNDHIEIRAIDFQDLRPGAPQDNEQLLPFFAYHYSSGPQIFGSFFQFDVDSVQLVRSAERKKRRLSGELSWQLPWIASGHRFDMALRIRSDAYHGDFTKTSETSDDKTDLHVIPRASLRWRYPLVRYGETMTYTLEPSWLAVLAPRDSSRDDVVDDEGSGFEWNDIALFQDERLVGRDRAESGKRIDYGLTFAIDGQQGQYQASFFAGQSYRFDDTTDFRRGSGLERDLSRLLIGSSLALGGTWHVSYKGGFDIEKDGRVSHELQARAKLLSLDVSSNYRLLQQGTTSHDSKREENETRLKWRIGDLRLSGGINYDVVKSRTLAYNAAVHYAVRDCLGVGIAFQRTFTRDRDYVPSDRLTFTFSLKHLGDISLR